MKLFSKIALIGLFILTGTVNGYAQMSDPVTFSVTDAPEKVKSGEKFTLTIDAEIAGNWHLYSVNNDPHAGPYPTKFSVESPNLALVDSVKESTPIEKFDPNFKVKLGWHKKQATFVIPLAFRRNIQGRQQGRVQVLYQVCNDKVCLPPEKKKITQSIIVNGVSDQVTGAFEDNAITQSQGPASVIQPLKNDKASVASNGLLWYIWIAIAAGFGALVTPCVYPMIPLTVSYFSKQADGSNRRALGPALGFGLAIVIIFTLLGVVLTFIIGASGANAFASNPWVNVFIALILVFFAMSLLGAVEIRLPYQLTNWLNKKSNQSSGAIGILFIALTISAVSFSCTVPFVGGLLTAMSRGRWFYPTVGMIFFSAAFASPFVLLAAFPAWLDSLPQSGSWMNIIKVLLGFIELGAAFKFLSNADLVWDWGLISRPFTIAAWIALSLLAGLYILGLFVIKSENKPVSVSPFRVVLSIPFLMFSFYLIPGLMGASLGVWDAWLPPKKATDVSLISSISHRKIVNSGGAEASRWSHNINDSMNEAMQENQPVFIDFSGYSCTNCRAMETNVFPRASVQQSFSQMKLVRLFTDDGDKASDYRKLQLRLTGTVAIPTYVIIDPRTKQVINQLQGLTPKNKFQHFLDHTIAVYKNGDSES